MAWVIAANLSSSYAHMPEMSSAPVVEALKERFNHMVLTKVMAYLLWCVTLMSDCIFIIVARAFRIIRKGADPKWMHWLFG